MTTFNNSLHAEIQDHIATGVHDLVGMEVSELHHELFNTDFYIIGHYKAEQWLLEHGVGIFTAIEFVQEYERGMFGETNTEISAESIVNMFTYIVGEQELWECLNNLNIDSDDTLTNEHVEMIQEYFSE